MLNAKKKFGIGLTLAGMALLLLAFLSIPFAWEMRIRWLLLGGGMIAALAGIGNAKVNAAGQGQQHQESKYDAYPAHDRTSTEFLH